MATSSPSIRQNMGAVDIVSTAFGVAKTDLRIAGMQLVAGILGIVPIIGPLLGVALSGLAIQFADETLGTDDHQNSTAERFVYSILTSIALYVIVFVGFLLLVLPGIYFALKLSLAIPAIWIGDKGPIEALSDSWTRTSGNLVTILGIGALFFLVAMVLLLPVFGVVLSGAALESIAEGGFLLASPILVLAILAVAVTIGSVSVAAQAVMYRAFGDGRVDDAFGATNDSTQF